MELLSDANKALGTTAFRRSPVVVVRHGERLDYVERAAGGNWCEANPEQPWNPPLTKKGLAMAEELGKALGENLLSDMGLPPIGAIYSSPFLRCRQTAAGILRGMNSVQKQKSPIKIKVEMGLAESINENWFRSWSLPGTDGTWGYKKEIPIAEFRESMDPRAMQSAESLLDWKESTPDSHGVVESVMDHDYESLTTIGGDYSFAENPPKLESFKIQRARMAKTMNLLSDVSNADDREGPRKTIVLVSHGGPVTHLYESLTGNRWEEHGVAKYCSFSIYEAQENSKGTPGSVEAIAWAPLVVNRVLWKDDAKDDANIDPSR